MRRHNVKSIPVINWPTRPGVNGRSPPWVLAAALLVLLASSSARADFKLYVFDDGVLTNTFNVPSGGTIDTGMFDTTHFHVGRQVAPGVAFGIVAASNAPGSETRSFVNQLTYLATNTSIGLHTLTVAASDVGFMLPSTSTLILRNAVNVTWGESGTGTGASDTLSFTSFVNTLNKQFDADTNPTSPSGIGTAASGSVPSTTITLTSPDGPGRTGSGNSPDVFFSAAGPYSITDELSLTLAGGNGAEINGASNVFPTPAPSGLVAMASCIPLIGLVTWMYRRRQPPSLA